MTKIINQLKSFFPSKEGEEKLKKLKDYIACNTIKFCVEKIKENEKRYFLATTYLKKGEIITTGETLEELNENIKDAIFTAFDVPAHYCNNDILNNNLEVKQLEYVASQNSIGCSSK